MLKISLPRIHLFLVELLHQILESINRQKVLDLSSARANLAQVLATTQAIIQTFQWVVELHQGSP